jgi:hypothetical protein
MTKGGTTVERAGTIDIQLASGLFLATPQDDFLPKGKVKVLENYRALGGLNERIIGPRLFTNSVLHPAPLAAAPILAIVPFEDFNGQGYVFGFTDRRIYQLNLGTRDWGAEFTSIYDVGTITVVGPFPQVTVTINGGDGDGTGAANRWPLKVNDYIQEPGGLWYRINNVAGSNPCVLTVDGGFVGAHAAVPYEVQRLFTVGPDDTYTWCFYNHQGAARIIVTNGADPIMYWDPAAAMATFQPLEGVEALRGWPIDPADPAGTVATDLRAKIVVAYKEMLLAMNCRERLLTIPAAPVWQPWMEFPQRIRNTDLQSCEDWDLVDGLGYANWNDRVDSPGPIECAANWRDTVVVAKRDQVELMKYTGGTQPVFYIQKMLHNEGTQFRHGMTPYKEDMVLVGNRNIYVLAGSLPISIGDQVADEFFDNMDEEGAQQLHTLHSKNRKEIWFFFRMKGFGRTNHGCNWAYIWNYLHNTWSTVEVSGDTPLAGVTSACVIPYLRQGIPYGAMRNLTYADMGAVLTYGDMTTEVMETALMGSEDGRVAHWEEGDYFDTTPLPLALFCVRDGLLTTGILGFGDLNWRLLEVLVAFERKRTDYEFLVQYDNHKRSPDMMQYNTGWLAEGTLVDITAKYFCIHIRQLTTEEFVASEMAQLRLRYYLRGPK